MLKFLIQWVLWSECGRVLSEKLLLQALRPFAVVLRGKAWCGIAGALERDCGTPVSFPVSRFFHVSSMNRRAFLSVPYQDAPLHSRLKSNKVGGPGNGEPQQTFLLYKLIVSGTFSQKQKADQQSEIEHRNQIAGGLAYRW